MKDPITIKKIQDTAKELKFESFAFWLSKACKIELNADKGVCVLVYDDRSKFESVNRYAKHGEIVFTKVLEKPVILHTILRDKNVGASKAKT